MTAARVLPWRVPPGQGQADPCRVWLSEIMLQQTTVAAVKSYYERFTALWPRLAIFPPQGCGCHGRMGGAGMLCRAEICLPARAVAAAGGVFPRSRAAAGASGGWALSSAAIAAIAYDRPETVVDGNVERVVTEFSLSRRLPPTRASRLRNPDAAATARRLCAGDGSGCDNLHAAQPGLRNLPLGGACDANGRDHPAGCHARRRNRRNRSGVGWPGWC